MSVVAWEFLCMTGVLCPAGHSGRVPMVTVTVADVMYASDCAALLRWFVNSVYRPLTTRPSDI